MVGRVGYMVAASVLLSSTANALEARVSKETQSSPAAVWAAIGDFCGISTWHPAVAKCELSTKDGATFRTLTLKDGAKLLEKQTGFDANAKNYSYTIEEGPLPVANYKSTLKVTGTEGAAVIDWSGNFDAKGAAGAEAVKIITGIYSAGADALAAKLKK